MSTCMGVTKKGKPCKKKVKNGRYCNLHITQEHKNTKECDNLDTARGENYATGHESTISEHAKNAAGSSQDTR